VKNGEVVAGGGAIEVCRHAFFFFSLLTHECRWTSRRTSANMLFPFLGNNNLS
jgi:hypothetical protein